jgi:hypothetical protein
MVSRTVLGASELPIEARRVAWSRLWQILLREPPNDALEQQGSEPSSEFAETDGAAACARSEMEVTMAE